jgi:hypothetical protein
MTLEHEIAFAFDLPLSAEEAVAFVRDVPRSLAYADFIRSLAHDAGPPAVVAAELPVNAALFGQRLLPFRSELRLRDDGAELVGLPLDHDGPGWAQVDGVARVETRGSAARVGYTFRIRVHLTLPEAERWGGHALLRMIRYTAQTVLERVTADFPAAIERAAREALA